MTEARVMLQETDDIKNETFAHINECVSKWKETPFLKPLGKNDPMNNPQIMGTTAVLLENQKEALKSLNEDTTTGNVSYYTKHTFPVLRRVWPNLIANQIVSVQPMNSPIGGVFYFEKVYTDAKGVKIPYDGISNNPTDLGYEGKLEAGDNIIQNFAKNYSDEFVDYDEVCSDTGTAPDSLTQASPNSTAANWKPIRGNGTLGQRTFFVKAFYRFVDPDNANAETEAVATMDDSGNLVDDTANTNTVGTFNIATGAWSIDPVGSAGTEAGATFVSNTSVYLQYFVEWEQVGYTDGAAIPSIELNTVLQEIRAKKRPLKARWSVESVEDMKALHAINVEEEIVNEFSNHILQEIDDEIISELIAGAQWSASYTYSPTVPGEVESIRQALTILGALSAQIQKSTLRGHANFIVAGPEFCALLDQLSTHGDYASIESNVVSASYGPVMSHMGISRVGTLLRKWTVYCNPFQDATKVLIGLRGNSYWDAGYVYAPYVPLNLTPTFLDPNDQTNRKGAWTRYANKMLRREYYGVMTVSGLPTVS